MDNKMTQMTREIFRDHLEKTLNEIIKEKKIVFSDIKFAIVPIVEPGKLLDGRDDRMRLWALSEKNVGNRLLSFDDSTRLLSSQCPFTPIWINVSFQEMQEDTAIFKLETSLRFRKPTLLRNAETGHAPFKAIL